MSSTDSVYGPDRRRAAVPAAEPAMPPPPPPPGDGDVDNSDNNHNNNHSDNNNHNNNNNHSDNNSNHRYNRNIQKVDSCGDYDAAEWAGVGNGKAGPGLDWAWILDRMAIRGRARVSADVEFSNCGSQITDRNDGSDPDNNNGDGNNNNYDNDDDNNDDNYNDYRNGDEDYGYDYGDFCGDEAEEDYEYNDDNYYYWLSFIVIGPSLHYSFWF